MELTLLEAPMTLVVICLMNQLEILLFSGGTEIHFYHYLPRLSAHSPIA